MANSADDTVIVPAADLPPSPPADPAGRIPQGVAEDGDNFDDFAALRPQPDFPDFDDDDEEDDIAARLGWGSDGTSELGQERKPFSKYYLFAGAGVVVLLVVVAVIMVLQADPPELSTTPREVPTAAESTGPAQPTARIDLKEPVIKGNKVVLTWTSEPETLDFSVVVIKGSTKGKPIFVQRVHTWSTTIDVASPYCFQIEASNSVAAEPQVYWSQTRSINGSTCHS